MNNKSLIQHSSLHKFLVPLVAIIFLLSSAETVVGQPRSCSNADGKQYAEGSRLGPFKCQGGQWIYVGD